MAKFRKKPVVIEAHQLTPDGMLADTYWPDWLKAAFDADERESGNPAIWIEADGWHCGTLEGPHKITPNDWIIRGVKGEIYPCKPDIFEATYEPAPSE